MLLHPWKLTAKNDDLISSHGFPFSSFVNFRCPSSFSRVWSPFYASYLCLLVKEKQTPLAGGICTHIGPQVYWRSLTDFWGRVLFQQKPFKCFSVTGLLDYQQHDIGVSGGTSVLLLEDDPACFWGVKVYFRRKKSFWGGSLKIYAPHSLKTNITPENRPSKNRKESPSNHPCSERLLLVLRRVALFNGFLSQQVI